MKVQKSRKYKFKVGELVKTSLYPLLETISNKYGKICHIKRGSLYYPYVVKLVDTKKLYSFNESELKSTSEVEKILYGDN